MASVPTLSYSAVRTYLECPLRYKFLYIDRLPEAPRGYFSFGRTIHSVLEELVRPLIVPTERRTAAGASQKTLDEWHGAAPATPAVSLMSIEELDRTYDRLWSGEGYTSPEEESRYRSLGREILRKFRDGIEESPPTPVSVEEHLEAKWEGIPVHGYIDRIDQTPDGGLEVVDYKTSREIGGEEVRESDQLGLYQVLVEHNYSRPVERLTLYHLRSLTPLSSPPRADVELEGLLGRVSTVRDGIRGETFDPTPGRHCQRCDFKPLCPVWRNVPEGDQSRLTALVDRFVELRGQEVRLENELRAAAETLHAEAERLGVYRLPGTKDVLLRRKEENWRFPSEFVGPLLKEHGLGDRVDPRDPESVRRMLRDPRLDTELKRRVESSGSRQVRWYWALEESASRDRIPS